MSPIISWAVGSDSVFSRALEPSFTIYAGTEIAIRRNRRESGDEGLSSIWPSFHDALTAFAAL